MFFICCIVPGSPEPHLEVLLKHYPEVLRAKVNATSVPLADVPALGIAHFDL